MRVIDSLVLGGLLLTAAILPLQTFSSQFSIAMCLLLLLLWGARAALLRQAVVVWTPLHLTLLGFLAIALLQLIPLPFQVHPLAFNHSFEGLPVLLDQWNRVSWDERTTARAAAVLASLIGFFFIATSFIDSRGRRRQVVNGLILIGSTISLLGVLDMFSPPGHPLLRGMSFLGLYFYSLHRLAGYIEMVFPLPLALLLAGGARRGQWVWYGFAAITMGVAIALANSTGALFVLVVEVMSLLLLISKQRAEVRPWRSGSRRRIRLALGASAVVSTIIAGVIWLGTESIPQMVESDVSGNVNTVSRDRQGASTSDHYSRAEIWKSTLRLTADHPILGVGLGVEPIAYTGYDPSSGAKLVNAAHNDYLQLLSETGLIGGFTMILFLGFLARLSASALKNETSLGRALALGAIIGCLGILVHSLVDFHLQSPGTALLFLMLIALLVSLERAPPRWSRAKG